MMLKQSRSYQKMILVKNFIKGGNAHDLKNDISRFKKRIKELPL